MTKSILIRGLLLASALAFTACPSAKKCTTNADCASGQVCNTMSGICGAPTGGGLGGGAGGGGGSGGGTTGGGTGGGTTGGGTGGGTTGGGTGGGTTGGGTGGGTTMSNGGETCAMAVLVTGNVAGDTTGLVDNYAPPPTCTGFLNPGPDTVYRVSVPAGQRLSVRATAGAPNPHQYDLSVYLVPTPDTNCDAVAADGGSAIACLSGSDDPQLFDAVETATWLNTSSSAVEVFVIVDSGFAMTQTAPDGGAGVTHQGSFSLDIQLATPGTNGDRCDSAVTLTSGTALTNQDLANFGNDYQANSTTVPCVGVGSNDATYKIDVPAGQVLRLTVTPSATLDATLSLSDSAATCGTACVAGANAGAAGEPEQLSYKNTTGATQTIFAVVDGMFVSTGTFSIEGTVTAPPGDDTCSAPTALTMGTPLTNQSLDSYTDDFNGMVMGCSFRPRGDRTYTINVPAGDRLEVTLTPDATSNLDAILNLVEAAGACGTACLEVADDGFDGDPETLRFVNRSGSAQQYVIIVDAWSGTGNFSLSATISTPPADDVCQGATALSGTLTGQTTVGYTGDYGTGTGCPTAGYLGGDRAYSITVPAGERGVVTVTPAQLADGGAAFSPSISFVDGPAANCDLMPRVCQGSVSGAPAVRTATYFNQGTAAANVFAIVDSSSTTGAGFDIGFTSAVPPADDTCTTATTSLVVGTPATGSLATFVPDYLGGTGCAFASTGGADRVYRLSVPAMQTVTVTATPTDTSTTTGPRLVLNLVKTTAAVCDSAARTCAASGPATGRGTAATVSYVNTASTAQDVFVLLADAFTGTANTAFTVSATAAAIPAGETCESPTPITASGTLVGQSWMGFTRQYAIPDTSPTCLPYPLAERVYSVVVNPNQQLTVTATPDTGGTADPALNLIDGPASNCSDTATCLDASDDPADPEAVEVVTFTNTTTAAKTVFVVVGSWGLGTFSLNVQLQ